MNSEFYRLFKKSVKNLPICGRGDAIPPKTFVSWSLTQQLFVVPFLPQKQSNVFSPSPLQGSQTTFLYFVFLLIKTSSSPKFFQRFLMIFTCFFRVCLCQNGMTQFYVCVFPSKIIPLFVSFKWADNLVYSNHMASKVWWFKALKYGSEVFVKKWQRSWSSSLFKKACTWDTVETNNDATSHFAAVSPKYT